MRKTSTLSTVVVAILGTTLLAQSLFAQTTTPPTRPNETNQFAVQPTWAPATTPSATPTQQTTTQQNEVKVPDILARSAATPPATLPATPSATSQSAPVQQPIVPPAPQMGLKPVPVQQNPPITGQFQGNTLKPVAADLAPQEMAPYQTMTPQEPTGASPIRVQNAMPPQQDMAATPTKIAPRLTTPATTSPMSASMEQSTPSGNWLRTQQIGSTEPAKAFSPTIQESTFVQPASATLTTGDSMKTGDPKANNSQSSLHTDGPKLRVVSNGPGEISINKSARFIIQVENLEGRRAENVIVGINFPEFVEVSSSMPSSGSREMTDGKGESRLVWEIPIVESSATEKIVIDVIPREAKAFDVDVEWTFRPIRGKATVLVTQAQLQIQMSGPTEVLYGEKALYHVTVSNPGNGKAENVVVMLPEVLGGERASLGDIAPQGQKQFQVELIARAAGPMDLSTTVTADNNITESDTREIVVRRAALKVTIDGPPMKYAGSMSTYTVTVTNSGDAMAKDVIAAVAMPPGVQYASGIDGVEAIDGGIRWNVGMLSPGNHRTWQINCNMAVAGDINIEAATRGMGDLAATDKITTRVEAVADLVLTVEDPKGPLPTGDQTLYKITIKNRGTRAAKSVDVVMHFSEGVEPIETEGSASEIAPGQVTFAPIIQIDPGQEVTLKVIAIANKSGSHRFRAQCLCEESDSHEVAEGTTKFFGESRGTATRNADATNVPNAADAPSEFRR